MKTTPVDLRPDVARFVLAVRAHFADLERARGDSTAPAAGGTR